MRTWPRFIALFAGMLVFLSACATMPVKDCYQEDFSGFMVSPATVAFSDGIWLKGTLKHGTGELSRPDVRVSGEIMRINISKSAITGQTGTTEYLNVFVPVPSEVQVVRFGVGDEIIWQRP